jgi:alcohol dehydrogenase, propanol-preferring
MKALLLKKTCDLTTNKFPLEMTEVSIPVISDSEVLVKVSTCGVCHTELDEIEGRAIPSFFPIILGHQVVGKVVETGNKVTALKTGDRVGVGWFYSSCGKCSYCIEGNENLCQNFKATGKDVNGGYSEYMKVPASSAFLIPDNISDTHAAPLLCAGAIGYRSLRLAEIKNGENLGLTGFGASAHLVLKLAQHQYPDSKIFVFARSEKERDFASELGAYWVGDTNDHPNEKMKAIIDTTPAWKPVIEAMKHLAPGGRLIINAIRKENTDKSCLLELDYPVHLWMEKEIKSIANVAGRDIREFLELAGQIPIIPEIEEFSFENANKALVELKERKIKGAKVLKIC